MAPKPIVFPSSSSPGRRPQESSGRLINAYASKTITGAPSDIAHFRSPGLEQVMDAGYNHTRGFLPIGIGECIWILNERVVKFNQSYGLLTELGPLQGSESVTTARNNANPPHNVVVTNTGCFNLFVNGPPTSFKDGDLPGSPTSVCVYHGYFVWSFGNGYVYASDLNSVAINAASFTTEQGLFVRRVVPYGGRLYAFGDKWTGVYRDVGTIPFPFTREAEIPRGIIGTHAVAGWEPGWANQLIFVGDDFVVYRLDGYTPVPISSDAVSRDIRRSILLGNRNNISAYVYMYEKNPFWVVTSVGQWTWEYNVATGEWNERQSYGREDWKGFKSVRMFDTWLIGDEASGQLYRITGDVFDEGGDPLVWQVESGVLAGFPSGVSIPRVSFNITSGVGAYPDDFEPRVEISWSLDGGHTYGNPVLRALGGPGRTKSHPYILNSGLSKGQGVRYRLRVSDAVHVGLSGGVIDPVQKAYSG